MSGIDDAYTSLRSRRDYIIDNQRIGTEMDARTDNTSAQRIPTGDQIVNNPNLLRTALIGHQTTQAAAPQVKQHEMPEWLHQKIYGKKNAGQGDSIDRFSRGLLGRR